MTAADLLGIHAPNRRLQDIPGGADSFWQQVRVSKAKYVKLLYPDHCRADAARAKAAGCKVIVRVPGEGICYAVDIEKCLHEFAGVADVFELGNEPDAGNMWIHLWFIRDNVHQMKERCNAAGILLCSPGHTGNAAAPIKPADDRPWEQWPDGDPNKLPACIIQSYALLDCIGFHAYGEVVLEQPQIDRIKAWAELWPDKELLGTEIGIAARILVPNDGSAQIYLISNKLKGARYGEFARLLVAQIAQVVVIVPFISDGCTAEFQVFTDAGVANAGGSRSYVIGDSGWAEMAAAAGA